jgi:hypothetical protein
MFRRKPFTKAFWISTILLLTGVATWFPLVYSNHFFHIFERTNEPWIRLDERYGIDLRAIWSAIQSYRREQHGQFPRRLNDLLSEGVISLTRGSSSRATSASGRAVEFPANVWAEIRYIPPRQGDIPSESPLIAYEWIRPSDEDRRFDWEMVGLFSDGNTKSLTQSDVDVIIGGTKASAD